MPPSRLAPALAALAHIAAAPAEPMTMKVMMRDHVNPAALDFWAGGNEAPEGETKAEAKERWKATLTAARTLQTYGALMQTPEHTRVGRWNEYAALMAEQGKLGEAAAKTEDADKAFEIGARLYDSCAGCHNLYIPRPARLP